MMDKKIHETREINLDDLISFQLHPTQLYQGMRLKQLANSIEKVGLINPIIVRSAGDGKYEIICGHNRVNAVRMLGRDVILADVWEELSDDEAIELFYDSNLNQQSFSDWNYTQKIKAIQYIVKLIDENSQQGKRNDLVKNDPVTEEETSVQSRHKLDKGSRRSTTRDRMSRRLGIATATLSKYRKIIKLPSDILDVIAQMLDEKKITFEAAYRMSGLNHNEIKWLMEYIEQSPDKKVDLARLKEVADKGKGSSQGNLPVLSRELIRSVLVPRDSGRDTRHQTVDNS